MTEGIEADPTDPGTQRPNVKPLRKSGTHFEPIELEEWDPQIALPDGMSPSTPMDIFGQYYTPQMMEIIATNTNLYERTPEDPTQPYARAHRWFPTCAQEIYLYFAIRIYMTLYPEYELEYYWDTRSTTPFHPFTQYISKDRFMELRIRYRVAPPGHSDIWQRVCFRP
jgi:hypothetical protein